MVNLTNLEKETQINWNQAEENCHVYTYDARIVRLFEKYGIEYTKDENGLVEAEFPKTWVKIRGPSQLSDEARQKLSEAAKARFGKKSN